MPPISTCPRCRLQISVPENVSPAALVKCPLCSAEYTLREALDEAPPMLIVLDPGPEALAAASVMSEAAVGDELDAGSTRRLPQVEFPDMPAGEGDVLAHFADEDDGGRVSLGDEEPHEGGAIIGGVLRDRDEPGRNELDRHDDFLLGTREDASDASTAVSARRGQRKGGGIGELIKAVLGAVVGLALGYLILIWLGRDPLQLEPYFAEYVPWLLP